ncbi:hypothetical protein HanXRQr2_Chr16g0752601 [Helianthus annuus]|uniref:Uncharacterized protein n=1 Tax=Helianthus annuus TaxID=4232 RepID=A0A9K3GYE0_HELAN|nr:hypothetical protein HanXRQr2_Chr16g0752601 [Helianthus annuus]KAJ0821533.1 hypothetical protein HanPSC8_Chr16g0721351 [Helianthus annuus]
MLFHSVSSSLLLCGGLFCDITLNGFYYIKEKNKKRNKKNGTKTINHASSRIGTRVS